MSKREVEREKVKKVTLGFVKVEVVVTLARRVAADWWGWRHQWGGLWRWTVSSGRLQSSGCSLNLCHQARGQGVSLPKARTARKEAELHI